MTDNPPLETYMMLVSPIELGDVIAVLDQLSFLDWTAHSVGTPGGVEVEISFNQACRPVDAERSVVSARGQR